MVCWLWPANMKKVRLQCIFEMPSLVPHARITLLSTACIMCYMSLLRVCSQCHCEHQTLLVMAEAVAEACQAALKKSLQQTMFVLSAGRRLLFENAQQSLKAIQSLHSYQHVVLQPFTLEEVQQYMRVVLDRHNITDQIAAAVHERTGGLPLYVEQVSHNCHCCAHMRQLACVQC